MDVSIGGLTATPQVLHFYADRDLVTMGNIEALPSLMRGGNKIRVGRDHGYGIFAVQDIKAGEVVEEAPVLAQSSPFLTDYTFSAAGKHIIPLGNIALYNHSDSPNCTHALDDSGSVMTLTASRDIRAGDQLSITYGSSLWFQSRGLQPRTLE
jgi:hypothetical protein